MEYFKQLGERLEAEWRGKNYDESVFPALAADALSAACLPQKYSVWQILEWTLKQTEIPRQRDLSGNFGEPPITVYSAPRFYIDVYFWFHGTTTTHRHAFCGAFQVMHGSSIHSWYEFDLHEKINAFCEIGDMRLKSCDLLNVGDVQPILPGAQYIHGLFHLDHPSATITVRTDMSPLEMPQFDYHKPGLAVDPFYGDEAGIKKIQAIGALIRAGHNETDQMLADLLSESDLHSSYIYLSGVHAQLTSNSLEQVFGDEGSRKRFDALLDVVEAKHGSRAEILRKVFNYRERLDDLVRRRGFVSGSEHRFFFALLLNVEGRKRILELIRDRYPDADPLEKVLDWAMELSQIRIAGMQNQNALGIAPFDDFDLLILENQLYGKTVDEISASVRETCPPEKAEILLPTIKDRANVIRNSSVFSPLLNGIKLVCGPH
jgi:hypothetical protein